MKNFASHGLAAILLIVSSAYLMADPAQDARDAYAKGDYPAAASAFQTAISSKGPSAELYYNLATAQLKAGERPAAALNLRRALMIDPNLADARVSLSEVERSQGVPMRADDWRTLLVEKVSLAGLLIGGAVVFWIGAFALIRSLTKHNRKAFPALMASCLLLLGGVAIAAAILADPKVSERNSGVILSGEPVQLLATPADSSPSVSKLPPACPVRILGRSGEWTYCETASGEKGWVPSSAVEAVVPAA